MGTPFTGHWKRVFKRPLLRPQDTTFVVRSKTSNRYGAILPEPPTVRFGFLGVIFTVTVGLLVGAAISKNIANFLEENDLFVPSDDDDDDD